MITDKSISLLFMTEKLGGRGEDAPPVLSIKGNAYAVGVFDGMGGSGSTLCDSKYGEGYTKAYVASRIVAESIQVYLDNHLGTEDVKEEDMKTVVQRELRKQQELYPQKTKVILRSRQMLNYPTTMAVVTLTELDNNLSIDSYWAGDSHCYLWSKNGFYQINKDDLEEDNDPLENLHNDSPISNCICTDYDFCINHNHFTLPKEPTIIICATDGCFGFYPTPMHFEYMLKYTLSKAKDENEWKSHIISKIQDVTGDDASLSLIGIGFKSFSKLKELGNIPIKGFKEIRKSEKAMTWVKKLLGLKTNNFNQAVSDGWAIYKREYMKYIINENNANA